MAEDPEDNDDDLLEEAKERADLCVEYYSSEYSRGREDVSFAMMGDQWPEKIKNKREVEGRPCLTENRVHTSILQVINSIRQSRPAIQVNPVDSEADIETARVLRGIVRNIETQSGADNVYDTGALNSVTAGYGWIRVLTEFADDASFDQEVKIVRIPDFSAVMIDPNSKELDGSDAEYGFVFTDMEHEAFEKKYPDAEPVSFREYDQTGGWCSENTVRIAEYFYKEYDKKTIVMTTMAGVMEKSRADEARLEYTSEREVQIPSVKWCKFTGNAVLEKTDWLGKYIPLIPVYGEEVNDDGRRKFLSLVTHAKDPQRRFNYWLTANTEIIALQPKAPYIGITGQFKSSAKKWASANNETYAFLEYDTVKFPDGTYAASAPSRQPAPMGSPAMFQETMAAADGIKATLGIFDASLGNESNEKSGKAINARQAQSDNSTFHFVDNLQTSIRQVGRILIDLIPKVYTGPRILRIIGEDGTKMQVPINQPAVKAEKGNYAVAPQGSPSEAFFDLGVGKYDAVATVGPSYATQRMETADKLQGIMEKVPGAAAVIGDLYIKSLDIPDADMIAERLRKMNPAMQDDDKDARTQQLQKADQAIKAMQGQMEQMAQALDAKKQKADAETASEIQKNDAQTQKTLAEVEKIKADTELARANAAAAIASAPAEGLTPEHVQEVIRTIAELEALSKDTADAVHILLSHEESKQAPSQPAQIATQPEQIDA